MSDFVRLRNDLKKNQLELGSRGGTCHSAPQMATPTVANILLCTVPRRDPSRMTAQHARELLLPVQCTALAVIGKTLKSFACRMSYVVYRVSCVVCPACGRGHH